jgi:hypothetical protein
MKPAYDLLVVGAGFAGAVLAERFARDRWTLITTIVSGSYPIVPCVSKQRRWNRNTISRSFKLITRTISSLRASLKPSIYRPKTALYHDYPRISASIHLGPRSLLPNPKSGCARPICSVRPDDGGGKGRLVCWPAGYLSILQHGPGHCLSLGGVYAPHRCPTRVLEG